MGSEQPLTNKAERFLSANVDSPVVSAAVLPEGGARYRLQNGKVFLLTTAECRSMPVPRWLDVEIARAALGVQSSGGGQ